MSRGRRMADSSWEGSASCGLYSVSGDALRERNLLEATEIGFLSSFSEC